MRFSKTRTIVMYALFTAMICLLAFTPLGYLKTVGLEITFITIPVVIGAIVMVPTAGAVFGFIFGLTSFIQCFGMSPFGAALLAISPFGCLVTCIVPRTLMGWLTGLVFRAVDRAKPQSLLAFGAASLFGPVCNTVLFMTSLMLFFGRAELITNMRGTLNLFPFLAAFVGINGLVEALAGFVVCTAVCKALAHYFKRNSKPQTQQPEKAELPEKTELPDERQEAPENDTQEN